MTYEVIMAGFGGQGIMLIGKILALAGMFDNKHVTWFPSYGAEMRGGTAHCTVIISDRLIGSPVVVRPLAAIVMNQPSLEKFAPMVRHKGFLLINSSLAKPKSSLDDLECISIPVTEMADKLGTTKVANIIALSAFCASTKVVSWESLLRAVNESFSSKDRSILQVNHKALDVGRAQVMVNK